MSLWFTHCLLTWGLVLDFSYKWHYAHYKFRHCICYTYKMDVWWLYCIFSSLFLYSSLSSTCCFFLHCFPPFLLSGFPLFSVSDSQAGTAGVGPGGGPDSSQTRFSSSLPTYLPVQCQLSGADSAFFLREANQEVMRNGSLSLRTEPFFLHQLEPGVAAPQSLPSVNCSYGNLSIEQPIPVDLLQSPPPHLLLTTNQVTLNWKVKGQVVVPKVGSTRPWIQVLVVYCWIFNS